MKINELKHNLELGECGEYFNDYNNGYICDIISEIADNNTSIYYYDIEKFISENVELVNDTISEFGWEGCGSDLHKAGQLAEFCEIERELYDNLSDCMKLVIADYVFYQLEIEEVTPEQFEHLETIAEDADNGDRLEDVLEEVNELLSDEE